MMSAKPRLWPSATLAIVAILAIVALIWSPLLQGMPSADAQVSAPTPSPTASAPPSSDECASSWKMETSSYENNRWAAEGIPEIKHAATVEEAEKAAQAWLDVVRKDPALLKGAVIYFLDETVDTAALITEDGCASEKAVDLAIQLQLKLADSVITPDQAPSNGRNSGVEDGTVVVDAYDGVSGDRTAIKVVLPDGTVIWILARCGNPVTVGPPPPLPPGETDEKHPAEDPYPQGNAPTGGGVNHDPSSGTYIPPANMERPTDSPRVNPSAPAPSPAPGATTAPTPDPAPAPSREPSAPPPSAPETGCDASVPGVVC